MKFGNEFWLILFQEYIIPNLFAVCEIFYLSAVNYDPATTVPEIIDPVFAKTSQNARFLLR